MSSPPGTGIPQADGGSTEDNSRYRNYDPLSLRNRRSNSAQPGVPGSEGPPQAPYSPPKQRPLLDLQPCAPVAATAVAAYATPPLVAPLVAQEDTHLLPDSPRGYISPAAVSS